MPQDSRQRLPAPVISRRVVPQSIIDRTLLGLRERSAGWRESASVWAGQRDGVVQQVIFHHEIADDRGGPLSLELPEAAKLQLYGRLAAERQVLLALLHTHPEDWVGLSWIDQQNQISSRVGFWSIVLPHYGRCPWSWSDVGFHMRTAEGWYQLSAAEACANLLVPRA